jgi:hypothetical protein
MDENIENIIPTLMGEMSSDTENESKGLFDYYLDRIGICICRMSSSPMTQG